MDESIKQALIKRALGYNVEEKEIIADKNGKPLKVVVKHKHIPPDMAALNLIVSEENKGRW